MENVIRAGYISKGTMKDDLLTRVKALYSDLSYVWGNCNSLSKWDSWEEFQNNFALIQALYPRIVACVEYCSQKIKEETKLVCTNAEKKAAAKQFIDDMVQLNGIGEIVSDWIIGWGIDAVVAALNEKYGKDWGITDPSSVVATAASVTRIMSTPIPKVERDGN